MPNAKKSSKHSKLGKAGKKNQKKSRGWAKADVADVEEALEDNQIIEKLKKKAPEDGSGLSELFSIDTKGSCEGLSRSSRREIARAKIFPVKGPNIGLSAAEHQKIERARSKLIARRREANVKKKVKKAPEFHDIWSESAPSSGPKPLQGTQVGRKVKPAAGPHPPQKPGTMNKKEGLAPAVMVPHEGQSINPEYSAFEDLTVGAAEKHLLKEEQEQKIEARLRPITSELRQLVGAEKLKGMSDDEKMKLYLELTGKKIEDKDVEPADAHKKKWSKSAAARSKMHQTKKYTAKEIQRRQDAKLEKSVGDIGAIMKELQAADVASKSKKEKKAEMHREQIETERKAGVVPKKRRLGNTPFDEPAQEIPDYEAAGGGLRSMPLTGSNAVKDRLSSIVRRGMLTANPEATHGLAARHKRAANRKKNMRKFVSPLMRSNLLLR